MRSIAISSTKRSSTAPASRRGRCGPRRAGCSPQASIADLNRIAEQLRAAPSGSSEEQRLWEQAQEIVVKDEALGVFALFGPVVTAWNAQRLGDVEVIPGPVNFPNYWKLYVKKR